MKNEWSNIKAKQYIKKYKNLGFSKDIALRVYTTRLLGRNKELVLHGGGNTSVKTSIKDIDGKKYDVLCVKGSGWDMADIEPPGLPAVKLEPLLALKNKKYLSDEDMVSYQKRNLINIKSPNPSVETFLHAFLPFKYVDHTHADAILNVTNRPGGLNFCKKIFGNKVSIVPYVMPGFMLSKKVSEIYSKNPNINCLILMNHGIFTFANDCKEAYDLMIKYVSKAERAVKKLKSRKIKQIKKFSTKFNIHEVAPIIRGLLSQNKDQKFVINYRLNKNLKYDYYQGIKWETIKIPFYYSMPSVKKRYYFHCDGSKSDENLIHRFHYFHWIPFMLPLQIFWINESLINVVNMHKIVCRIFPIRKIII